jgi:hypothetical protein
MDDVLRWGWTATGANSATWDFEGFCAIAARNVQVVRDVGALAQLPLHLSSLGIATMSTGDFEGAGFLIAEAESVAAATGTRSAPTAALRLRALQGRESEASELIAATIKQAEERGHGIAMTVARWAAAVLYNGLGRYDEAASAAVEPPPRPSTVGIHLDAARADRGRLAHRRPRTRARCVEAAGGIDTNVRHRSRAWYRGAFAGSTERGRDRRASVRRGG